MRLNSTTGAVVKVPKAPASLTGRSGGVPNVTRPMHRPTGSARGAKPLPRSEKVI